MAAFDLPRLAAIGEDEIVRFRRDGFLVVERILSEERIAALRERFTPLFAGRFDTGVYPDEWYWREGMSLPDVTRHMANAWKRSEEHTSETQSTMSRSSAVFCLN